jgi:hypothetical protein
MSKIGYTVLGALFKAAALAAFSLFVAAMTILGLVSIAEPVEPPAPVVPYAAIQIAQCGTPLALVVTYSNGGYEGGTVANMAALVGLLEVAMIAPEERRITMILPSISPCPERF